MAGTIRQALQQSTLPRVEQQMLLGHVLGRQRAWLMTHDDDPLPDELEQQFKTLVQRRHNGEPVAYLLGQRAFFDQELAVGAGVLIPRPETELLVEAALARLPAAAATILDLGTGSGCIAIALAKRRTDCAVTAVERSTAALHYAEQNRSTAQASNLRLLQGSWYEPVAHLQFDMIVSNPPYIAADDIHLQQGDLRFEPLSALAAGADGLDDLRHIVGLAPQHLRPLGWLLVEHGYQQQAACQALFNDAGFSAVTTLRDLAGQPRVTLGQRRQDD